MFDGFRAHFAAAAGSVLGWTGLFQPLGDFLVDAVCVDAPARVLDVGCGTGATTLTIAQRVGAAGTCTSIDISEPMVVASRDHAAREGVAARFVLTHAQRHRFDGAPADVIASRFGVMFFDDVVEAFANLETAARRGARCDALCGAALRRTR